jgi:hypothetical protein
MTFRSRHEAETASGRLTTVRDHLQSTSWLCNSFTPPREIEPPAAPYTETNSRSRDTPPASRACLYLHFPSSRRNSISLLASPGAYIIG